MPSPKKERLIALTVFLYSFFSFCCGPSSFRTWVLLWKPRLACCSFAAVHVHTVSLSAFLPLFQFKYCIYHTNAVPTKHLIIIFIFYLFIIIIYMWGVLFFFVFFFAVVCFRWLLTVWHVWKQRHMKICVPSIAECYFFRL